MGRRPVQTSVSTRASVRDALQLREVFSSVDETSCPGEYNFHMHTTRSDGQLSPQNLVEQAIELGLKGLAITDHHTVSGYCEAKQHLEDWQWRHPASVCGGRRRAACLPRLWVGVEITAQLMNVEVHILGYAFNPAHQRIQSYLQGISPRGEAQQAEQVIAAIQDAGGFAVLAHPCRYRQPAEVLVPAAAQQGIDGIEVYYAYDNPREWRPCPRRTPMMRRLASEFDLLGTCGTDTHGPRLTRRI